MLENMRKIDWSALEAATGSAQAVPALIHDLTSDDPDVAEEALLGLSASIWEHGIVFDSTSAAVPFLIELLQRDAAHDPAGVLDLLAQIAESRDVQEVSLPPSHEYQFMPEGGEDYEKDEEEMAWSQQAYDAVAAGMAIYRKLLLNDEPTVRTSAAALLELFPVASRENAAALKQALEVEDDIAAMTDLMLSLRDVLASALMLDDEKSGYIAFFQSIYDDETDATLRLGAAISIAKLAPERLTADMRDLIADAVIDPLPYSEYVTDTLENPVHEALAALVALPPDLGTPLLLRAVRETGDPANARGVALQLLKGAFGQAPLDGYMRKIQRIRSRVSVTIYTPEDEDTELPPLQTALTPDQRAAAEAILDSDAYWVSPTNLLRIFGLPTQRKQLLAYLDDPAAYQEA
jgi:HEAT repeat protein